MDKIKKVVVNIVALLVVAVLVAIAVGLLLVVAGLVWSGVLTVWQMAMT